MISLTNYELEGPFIPPVKTCDPPVKTDYPDFEIAAEADFEQTKYVLWKNAIMLVNGGELPSEEEIAARATEIILKGGSALLLWDHPPREEGDPFDTDYIIASITKDDE